MIGRHRRVRAAPGPAFPLRYAARRAWSRFSAASWNDRIVLARVAIDLLRIDRRLRREGYRATYARLVKPHPLAARVRAMPVEEVARLVDAAARWTIGSRTSCLRRALLLTWLLRSAGVRCDLISGIGKGDTGWTGHAWVEVDGIPLRQDEDVDTRYRAFRDQLSRRHDDAGTPSTNSPIEPSSK